MSFLDCLRLPHGMSDADSLHRSNTRSLAVSLIIKTFGLSHLPMHCASDGEYNPDSNNLGWFKIVMGI